MSVVAPRFAYGQQSVVAAVSRAPGVMQEQAANGFTGVVLIGRDDSVLFSRAVVRAGAASDTGRSFYIGSITKSFTAAAIEELLARGSLRMEDSVGQLFPDAPADKRAITVRQLLTHTSGIEGAYAGQSCRDRLCAEQAILLQPLRAAPGTAYRYMDDDYELLAAVVERVSGAAWSDFITRQFLRPLGLRRTGFHGDDWAHRGAAGMRATARDLFRWAAAIRAGRVVSPAVSSVLGEPLLFVRREPPFDIHYGWGTRVYTRDSAVAEVMYSGSAEEDNTSIVRVLEDGTIIVVLSDAGQRSGSTWASVVANLICPRPRQ